MKKSIFLVLGFVAVLIVSGCVQQQRLGEGYHDENVIRILGASCRLDPQGMAWDGEFLWVTNEGSTPPYDAYIFKVDSKTGRVIGKWKASSYDECGAAYDGRYLWTTGGHNPNGVQPPWEDPDGYDLIYKYSIENGTPTLIERYAAPESPVMGIGNSIAFDEEGNLWVADGIGENKIKLMQLDLLTGVEAEYHPGLENVWKTGVVRSHIFDLRGLRVKGFDWVNWRDGKKELIISGYLFEDPDPLDMNYVLIIDPETYEIKLNHTWSVHGKGPKIGTFDMVWDPENEILWTLEGGSGNIYKHPGNSTRGVYLEDLLR